MYYDLKDDNKDKQNNLLGSPFEEIPYQYKKSSIDLTLIIYLLMQLLSCAETGLFISSSNNIKLDLKLNDFYYNLLCSMPAVGRGISSLLYLIIMKKINNKFFFIFGLLIKTTLFIFYHFQAYNFKFILISRMFFGVFQMYELAFIPGYCEDFFNKYYFEDEDENNNELNSTYSRTNFLIFFANHLTKPLGLIIGFYIFAFGNTYINWYNDYFIFGCLIGLMTLVLITLPKRLFKSNKMIYNKRRFIGKTTNEEIEDKNKKFKKDFPFSKKTETNGQNLNINNSELLGNTNMANNFFYFDNEDNLNDEFHNNKDIKQINNNESFSYVFMDDVVSNLSGSFTSQTSSNLSDNNAVLSNINNIEYKSKSYFFTMVKQPLFIFSLLSQCSLIFIYNTIQYNINEYLSNYFGIFDKIQICIVFVIISFISPLFGIILNAFINEFLLHNKKKIKLIIMLLAMIVNCGTTFLLSYANSPNLFFIFLWISFTLYHFILPSLANLLINSSFYVFKVEVYAINNFMNNLGSVLGNISFGLLNEKFREDDMIIYNISLKYFTIIIWLSLLFIFVTTYFQWILPEKVIKKKKYFRSEGTNYLRLTRTSEVNRDENNMCGDIIPVGRPTFIDEDNSSNDEEGTRKSFDDEHAFSLNNLLDDKNTNEMNTNNN